ncbi:unnamed protein product, partial [Brassica oleracea]
VKSRSFPSLSSSPASVNPNPSSKEIQIVKKKMQEQTTSSLPASSLPSSSERSSSSAPHLEIKEGIESDEEIRRVPEFGGEATGKEISGSATGQDQTQATVGGEGQRKRGRTPAEKETKRLKRLLRNRVSAQQARERKKAYLGELENRVKDLENRNSELEERLSTLQNENQMLRQVYVFLSIPRICSVND